MLIHKSQLFIPVPILCPSSDLHNTAMPRGCQVVSTWAPTGLPPLGSFSKMSNLSSLFPPGPDGRVSIRGAEVRERSTEA